MKKEIDILWLVEHVARELDVACAVKAIAEKKYGISIEIFHIYRDYEEILHKYSPKVVVHPFFYFLNGAMGTEEYVRAWPDAIHFNLAWEELFYPAHEKVKAPSDEYSKKHVIHHAWGDFYKEYLIKNGVPEDNIIVNGQPAYQLYLDPYKKYFCERKELSKKYHLDNSAKWIFIPENFRWAFLGKKIDFLVRMGENRQEIEEIIEHSKESLIKLLSWCNNLEKNKKIIFIFRPRPSTNSLEFNQFFLDNIGNKANNFFIIKEETVRDWILSSDIIISSFSTSLIEGAIAQKPIFIVEPLPIPDSLKYEWCDLVQSIKSSDEFDMIVSNNNAIKEDSALKIWAIKQMMTQGDPILNLASIIYQLTDNKILRSTKVNMNYQNKKNNLFGSLPKKFTEMLKNMQSPHKKKTIYNEKTHEMDFFTGDEITERVDKWKKIIGSN